MQTLGIDLSTDPKKVWACEIDWGASPPTITALDRFSDLPDPLTQASPPVGSGGPDPAPTTFTIASAKHGRVRSEASLIASLVDRVVAFGPGPGRMVGVDAPLGWPAAFVEAIADWDDGDLRGFKKRPDLRLRATDRFVHAVSRLTPMSVSTDRMGSTTMLLAETLSRAARRLDRQGFERAAGLDGIAEVHPAVALRCWTDEGGEEISISAYKSWFVPRETIVIKMARAGFAFTPEQGRTLINNDDALDAFVCALVARAAATGGCVLPGEPVDVQQLLPRQSQLGRADSVEQITERLDLARTLQLEAQRTSETEGWIHMPRRADLAVSLGLTPGSAAWVPESSLAPPRSQDDWFEEDWDDDDFEPVDPSGALGYGQLAPTDWAAVEQMRTDDGGDHGAPFGYGGRPRDRR